MILKSSSDYFNPVFAVGTGRCGTHMLTELMKINKNIVSHHIIDLDADSFLRYATWNNLNIDIGGFIHHRKTIIEKSKKNKKIFFESNPYLSFNIKQLFDYFNAKFIFIIRNPEDVVKSHINKGWYEDNPVILSKNKASGYQYGLKANHFFGRIIPLNEEFDHWINLTRVGKISWMWNKVNQKIIEQLEIIPDNNHFQIKIEQFDYIKYLELMKFIGTKKIIKEKQFDEIIQSRPGKGKHKTQRWTDKEYEEFFKETEIVRRNLNY